MYLSPRQAREQGSFDTPLFYLSLSFKYFPV